MTAKTFPTLHVATLITGIGLCEIKSEDGVFGHLSEIASHLIGAPVWTHELGRGSTHDAFVAEGYRLFPDMPTREEASEDWQAAAATATAAYGENVTIEEGTAGRTQGPLDTLAEMVPADKIIAVVG